MRVIIEIDEKSGASTTSTSAVDVTPVASAPDASVTPPADVLKMAAETGAINGGAAPSMSAVTDSAPHALHGRGAADSVTHASAISGGAAAATN